MLSCLGRSAQTLSASSTSQEVIQRPGSFQLSPRGALHPTQTQQYPHMPSPCASSLTPTLALLLTSRLLQPISHPGWFQEVLSLIWRLSCASTWSGFNLGSQWGTKSDGALDHCNFLQPHWSISCRQCSWWRVVHRFLRYKFSLYVMQLVRSTDAPQTRQWSLCWGISKLCLVTKTSF